MNTATCVGQQRKQCEDPLSSSSKRPTLHDILPVISMYWTFSSFFFLQLLAESLVTTLKMNEMHSLLSVNDFEPRKATISRTVDL